MIYLKPEESTVFFLRHQAELLTTRKVIASNGDTTIYISAYDDGRIFPIITVDILGVSEDMYSVSKVSSLEDTIYDIYYEYGVNNSEQTIADIAAEITSREEEIENAVADFLDVILCERVGAVYTDDVIKDCKERFLSYIFNNYDVDIYRPMYLESEDNGIQFCRYPYALLSNS